jgi:hypothetical protein
MASSGGGSGSDIASLIAMSQAAQPMQGLPIAGSNSATGDPYDYGKFQNFLPEIETPTLNPSTTDHPLIQNAGKNPSATGLRPYMFDYKSPRGNVVQGPPAAPAGGGASSADIQGLRNQLSQLLAGGGGGGRPMLTTAGSPGNLSSGSPEDGVKLYFG